MKTRRANTDHRHYSVCLAPLATHACMCLHHETVFGACFAWPGLLLATASTHSSISWSIFIKHAHHTLLTNTNACSRATRGGAISSAPATSTSSRMASALACAPHLSYPPPQTNRSIPFIPCHIDIYMPALLCIHPQIPSPPNNSSLLLLGFL